jgi:transcriptional regulator with XRE-family HTH domain
MPRPNKRRAVLAEVNLARRIALERDARGWTNDGLAKRLTDAGCAITGSAIFKIEKGDPPRRIVVDELVAFAKVFGVSLEELLLPPEVAARKELADLVVAWDTADTAYWTAESARTEAWVALKDYVGSHPELSGHLQVIFEVWAERYFAESDQALRTAQKMWDLTGDERWVQVIKADMERFLGESADG